MPLVLGVLVCLKRVWAVWIGLIISYWLVLHYIFLVHLFPSWPLLLGLLLAHRVLNAAKRRTQQRLPVEPVCSTPAASAPVPAAPEQLPETPATRAAAEGAPLRSLSTEPSEHTSRRETAAELRLGWAVAASIVLLLVVGGLLVAAWLWFPLGPSLGKPADAPPAIAPPATEKTDQHQRVPPREEQTRKQRWRSEMEELERIAQ